MQLSIVMKSGQLRNKLGRFTKKLEDGVEDHITAVAEFAIDISPVDTGNYITSHTLHGGGITTSRGKPRGQEWAPFAAEASANIASQASGLGKSEAVSLFNIAEYAQQVENKYNVYSATRREAGRLASEIFNGI